jgi:hypothetical protein
MEETQRKTVGEIYQMKTVNLSNTNVVEPIEWTPYTGETVIVKTIIRGGKKIQETKYFEDTVKAVPRGNAYCIGNGPSRKGFDLTSLTESGQTYGCNALYRDFVPDYLFSVDAPMSKKLSEDKVYEKSVCYAPTLEVNRNKGLTLIPRNPHYTSGNQAIWTATVHGHKNIYLIGYDFREYGPGQLNNMYQDTENYGERNGGDIFEAWYSTLRRIIKQRPYCNFTLVHDNPPEYFNHMQTGTDLKNTFKMTYAEFNNKVLNQAG